MKGRLVIVFAFCMISSGCASHAVSAQSQSTQLIPAHPTIEAPAVVKLPPPVVAPVQRKEVVVPGTLNNGTPPGRLTPLPLDQAVRSAEAARARSTQAASPSAYINAVAVYDYVPGQVYQVYTSPDYVTTLMLKPGEKLISKVAGDTTRWVIGDTITGDSSNPTTLVVLKPVRANLRTNLMLSTNQRVYQIDLVALGGNQYQNAVSWNYPQDDIRDAMAKVNALNTQTSQTELTGVAIENLNDDYNIDTTQGQKPDWMPKQVFDDGTKTYIDFPDNLGTTSAPPLFIVGMDGQADLVNYRVKGHFYIVDRLFDGAELRLGKDPPTVVTIKRQPVDARTASGPFGFVGR